MEPALTRLLSRLSLHQRLHIFAETIVQDLRSVALPHGMKGGTLRDRNHVDFPGGKVIICQLPILVAISGDFEQAQLYKVVIVDTHFLFENPLRSQRGIVDDHLPDL